MNRTLALIVVSGFCGGSVYPLIKIADSYDIPRFGYIFWEALIITLLLVAATLYQGEKKLVKKDEFKYYLFCALTNIVIPQTLFFIIASHLPASVIGIVIVLTPIFVYLSLALFMGQPMVRHKTIGVVLGLLGTSILFLPELSSSGISLDWRWLLFSFLLPVDYATNRIIVTKLRPPHSSSNSLAIGLFSLVVAISGVLMVATGQTYNPFVNINYGLVALVCHAVLMTVFYVIFFVLAKEGAVQNSLSFYVAPLTAMGWGILFFGEPLSFLLCISAALVFYGLYLLNRAY